MRLVQSTLPAQLAWYPSLGPAHATLRTPPCTPHTPHSTQWRGCIRKPRLRYYDPNDASALRNRTTESALRRRTTPRHDTPGRLHPGTAHPRPSCTDSWRTDSWQTNDYRHRHRLPERATVPVRLAPARSRSLRYQYADNRSGPQTGNSPSTGSGEPYSQKPFQRFAEDAGDGGPTGRPAVRRRARRRRAGGRCGGRRAASRPRTASR